MGGLRAEELLSRPVRFNGIELGRPVDVMLDLEARRAVGLELRCGDESRRFLALGAATVEADAIEVDSPLVLLDESELRFYRDQARTLRALRGTSVEERGRAIGVVRDVVLGEDGAIEEVVLADGPGAETRSVALNGLVLSGRVAR